MALAEPILTDWGIWLPARALAVFQLEEQMRLSLAPDLFSPVLLPRVLEKIATGGPFGCWEWQGYCHIKNHYSQIYDEVRKQPVQGHIYVWTRLIGPIPDGITLDHRCRNRHCVWPLHMEPKTGSANTKAAFDDRSRLRLNQMGQMPLHPSFHLPRPESGLRICWAKF